MPGKPSQSTPLRRALEDLKSACAELGGRWYLFGAIAAIQHGVHRSTADLDVTIEPAGRQTTEIGAILQRHGFHLKVSDRAFLESTRVLPVLHEQERIPVDIVLAGSGLEQAFLARAITLSIDGVDVPVARAEDLIVMKILAQREKDIDDVRSILRARAGQLDIVAIEELLGLLEQALDQSDLLVLFRRLHASP